MAEKEVASNDSTNTNAQEIWKRMTQKHKYLIYGYIHRIESKFKSLKIPKELFYLFAIFYVPLPDWDKELMQKDIIIKENRCIVNIDTSINSYWRSIFGKRVVTKYGKYEWNFEIVSINKEKIIGGQGWHIVIGILKDKYSKKLIKHLGGSIFIEFGKSIGFVTSSPRIQGGISHHKKKYANSTAKFENKGDKLKMTLDLDNKTLSYKINGKDYGNVDFGDKFVLDSNEKYRMGMSLCPGRTIKLS